MSFLKKILNTFKKPLTVFAFSIFLFSFSTVVFGQLTPDPTVPLEEGDLFGFAWMGTGITNPDTSEGGGGWLNFNCAPQYCDGINDWGVTVNFDESSPRYGYLSGQAWSSNYGWLSFEDDIVETCWEANQMETSPTPARVINLNETNSFKKPIVGWGKFISGDDVGNDGFTGCVSFTGVEYATLLDIQTGIVEGWAWGSDVVGWISFTNPECEFCDTSVVLPGSANLAFWAEDPSVPPGGETRLLWSAINSPTRSVKSCLVYSNTSGYGHWMSPGGDPATNAGIISTDAGNLSPNGSHNISGINQTTTYEITCRDSLNQVMPTKYATVAVIAPPVTGCTNPLATNYNPAANIPDNASCVYPPATVIGCMNPLATNYNPLATVDAGNCTLPIVLGCTIPTATNYNPLATVNDGSCIVNTPVIGCTNILATNYNPLATIDAGNCIYPPSVVIGCMDSTATNYNPLATVSAGNCTYGPGVTNLNLEVAATTFTVGSGSYNTGLIDWTSSIPVLVSPNSCTGKFTVNGTSQFLTGWSGSKNNPNSSIANMNLSSFASSAPDLTVFKFRIDCLSTSGAPLFSEDTIIMQSGPVDPPDPAPIIDLRILTPDVGYGSDYEILPDIGSMVNLGWSIQNADLDTCRGSSQMVVGGSPDVNNSWDNYDFTGSTSGSTNMDMTNGSPFFYPTMFTLKCENSDGVSASDSVQVMIDGIACPPSLPACTPPPGSNIPGYEEF